MIFFPIHMGKCRRLTAAKGSVPCRAYVQLKYSPYLSATSHGPPSSLQGGSKPLPVALADDHAFLPRDAARIIDRNGRGGAGQVTVT